jgi:hypothetical protein
VRKQILTIFGLVFFVGLFFLDCTEEKGRRAASKSENYEDLLSLFEEFRAFQNQGNSMGESGDIGEAMDKKYRDLGKYQSRLAAIDPSGWSVAEQIDYHLVRAEMNGLDFELRILRPWERDPAFYGGRRGGLERLPRLPLEEARIAEFRSRLQAIPESYEQAKKNLGGGDLSKISGDLAMFTIHYLDKKRDSLPNFITQLERHHPDLVGDAKKAQAAIDHYLNWLKENRAEMKALAGVGIANYNWLLKNVYLFPYTWEECRQIVEQEDNRVITFLRLEENRNRDVPPLEPVASQEEYRQSVRDALVHIMTFIQDEEIFTLHDYLVIDEYLQDRLRSTDKPWPEKHDYFFNFSHREPVMEETHEMVGHHFDLLRVQRDNRPIRGAREHEGPYDIACGRLEGWAFALEELMMHAGYLDDRSPHGRAITYEQAAFRTVRALSDLYMHRGDWSLKDAMDFCVANAPHGELLEDSPHLWHEMQTTLVHVGWHMQMVVGKVHFMKLFRDRSKQLGDDFNLKEFLDEFLESGVIPVSLIRWEMTGYEDEIQRLWGN